MEAHSVLPNTGLQAPDGAVKSFGIVNKAEVDVFLELSCFLNDAADVGNLISGSSDFSKTSLNTWKFMVCTVKAWLGELLC